MQPPETFESEHERLAAHIRGHLGIPPVSFVFSRAVAHAVGPWDEGLRQRQDADYLVRTILTGCPFLPEYESVVYYRRHGLQHIGHPANFGRHFPSRLAVADKWHGFLRDGVLPPQAAAALRAGMMHLLREACIARHAPSIDRCRRRLGQWFGEGALRAADTPGFKAQVWVKRTLARPMRRLVGELPLVHVKELVRHCKAIVPAPQPAGRSSQVHI